jgi:mRNA-degrading endonuclease YafQ of YafQ-DinJ toxin-antitoxin module
LRTPISGAQFRRDVKLAQKRGKDMAKLREVILMLIEGNPLPVRIIRSAANGAITATVTSSRTGC